MDKRAAFRFPTDIEAEVRSCNRSWPSRMRNISTGGCLITSDAALPQGTLLRIRIKGLTAIDGAIAWSHRGHAGVRFLAALHPAVMEHLAFRGREEDLTGRAPNPPVLPPAADAGLHAELVKRGTPTNDDRGLAQAS
jgi:hypothetical protein